MPVALITGASTGIGREFARICARDGYDLVLTARSLPQLESLASEIRGSAGHTVHVFAKDLSNPAASAELHDELSRAGLSIDLLINNAGFGLVGKFWELDEAAQMEMIRLNIGALTHLSRLFCPDSFSAGAAESSTSPPRPHFSPVP